MKTTTAAIFFQRTSYSIDQAIPITMVCGKVFETPEYHTYTLHNKAILPTCRDPVSTPSSHTQAANPSCPIGENACQAGA